MGLTAELGYHIGDPTLLHRSVRAVASTSLGARALAHTLPAMDRAVARLSAGRTTAVELLAGLPLLELTTTGRRSGQPRYAPLVAVPFRDSLALLGTNFGQAGTPTWVLNLEDDPRATVAHGQVTLEVVARPADAAEREEILAEAGRVYIGYPKYLRRITGRRVRVFVLERPAAS
ncbi:MAG: nitroreductase family deazaflavin-dependent oxidoreductase [Ornithinibacter sp.]